MDEYLERLFNAELDSQGAIDILDLEFYRSDILVQLDKTAYDDAFIEWKNRRKQENVSKVKNLDEIEQNESRLKTLKGLYNRDSIIPFVGAGLSVPSGISGWTEFLYQMRESTGIKLEDFESIIKNQGYEEAAQALLEELKEGSFLERVESTFELNEDSNIEGVVNKIPEIFESVITTNFDSILKTCYDNSQKSFDEILIGSEAEEIPRFLGQNKRILLRLHGRANSSKNRILTKSEYDLHYENSAILNSVYKAICTKTLLFLGCSLSYDRTLATMQEVVKEMGHENLPRHYAFLKLPADQNEILGKSVSLAKANIFPIWYDGDHDSDIEALLDFLSSAK